MALQKSFETPTGNSGDYWRVDLITLERKDLKMECRLNLYKSQADRVDGKQRMDQQEVINLDIPAGTTTLAELIAGIYTDAKVTLTNNQAPGDVPFFDGATDI